MKSVRMLALKAVLLGTMAAPFLVIPAVGQQEVDPTIYPIPEATKVVAHPEKKAMTAAKRKARAASSARPERQPNRLSRRELTVAQNHSQALPSK